QGLTNQLQVWWGGDFTAPTTEQASAFQKIAWETVQNYERSCIVENTTSVVNISKSEQPIITFDNLSNTISIASKSNDAAGIYDIYGQLIHSSFEKNISLSDTPNGVYIIRIGDTIEKIIVAK